MAKSMRPWRVRQQPPEVRCWTLTGRTERSQRGRPGDQTNPFADLLTDCPGASPVPFWVQRVKPPLVERMDHIPHILGADLQQRGDVPNRLTQMMVAVDDEDAADGA